MPSASNEALEWFDRAEQARETAEQLTDPDAREAVQRLAEHFECLARAAARHPRPRKGGRPSTARKETRLFSRPSVSLTGRALANGSARGKLTPEEGARIIQIQDLLIECFVEHRDASVERKEERVKQLEAKIDGLLCEKKDIEKWATLGSA